MTYRELLLQAESKLDHNDITLGEFEQMIAPLNREVDVLDKIKAEIADFMAEIPTLGNCKEGWHNAGQRIGLEQACEIIDKHIREDGE